MKKILFMLLLVSSGVFAQNPGSLDTSFYSNGVLIMAPGNQHDVIQDITQQPDGKILFCGVGRIFSTSGFNFDVVVGRRNYDGTIDSTFGTAGFVEKDFGVGSDFAYKLTLQPDGKIVVVGGASIGTVANTDFMVMRLNTDGSYDTTFAAGAGFMTFPINTSEDYAYDVLIQPDQKILIGGSTKVPGFSYERGVLVRLETDGSFDASFGTNGISILTPSVNTLSQNFECISLLPSGNIIAAGSSSQSTNMYLMVAGFNADGTVNTSFGTNGTYITSFSIEKAYDMVVDQGFIYTGGEATNSGGMDVALMKFDTLGVVQSTWGTNGFVISNFNPIDACYGLAMQPDGKLLVGGTSGQGGFGGARSFLAARYLSTGVIDSTFGVDGKTTITIGSAFADANALALQSDGKILLGGFAAFTNNDMIIVRLLNDSLNTTALNEPELENNSWQVYPVPFSGNSITIKNVSEKKSEVEISFLNSQGKLISFINQGIVNQNSEMLMSIPEGLASGIYFIRITSAGKNKVLPVIKN